MYILGFNCFVFNSAACLIKDGELIASVQEERFTREKHTGKFPINAIRFCLKKEGITVNDLDYVGFHWQPFYKFYRRVGHILRYLPKSLNFFNSHANIWMNMVNAESIFKKYFANKLNKKQKFKFIRVRHSMCHAGSAYFVSPFDEAAVITMDGSGEVASTTFSVGEGNKLKTIKEIYFPHSLGYLFAAITHYLGFRPDYDEFKLMSLQSYGNDEYYEKFKKIIKLTADGGYKIDLDYFIYHLGIRNPWVSKKFFDAFGPLRKRNEPLTDRHKNICRAVQKRLEDIALHMANHIYKLTKKKYLCLAGGSALNSVMNGILVKKGPFKDVFVQPAANDGGTCIGSAYYIYNHILNNSKKYILENVYLGPSYSNEQILPVIEKSKIPYKYYDNPSLLKKTAKLIARGNIIAWFQEGMELGPRALGARSILADPRKAEMKDILNRRVKHREGFRPFAPVIMDEHTKEYFDWDRPSPHMVFVCEVKEDKRSVIPGITHIDGTARLQTVTEKQNKKYWQLIKEFKELTSVPVLINTSFNVMGEPIVCSPGDAIRCFKSTGIDHLVIGNYIVSKN